MYRKGQNSKEKYRNRQLLCNQIDWFVTLIPMFAVSIIFVVFVLKPDSSKTILDRIREFINNECGLYYMVLGTGTFACSIYVAFSKYGKIVLGEMNEPKYPSFKWGAMIFTSTMAADILFYSLCEWALYAEEPYIKQMGGIQKWASTYPLFHWGPIAWGFYIILAVAFGFMLHVKKRERQRFSEACYPVLGKRTNGLVGKMIDIIAIFALLAGTATTFSLATPLLSSALGHILGLTEEKCITIVLLLLVMAIYTLTVWFGMKGISKLANICIGLFLLLLIYFLVGGGEAIYILETGYSAVGNLLQNFVTMSTWMDPLRDTLFPQSWTIYYWSYWIVWCVATPFFIGSISKGRTIKNVILGGYGWGIAGTFSSFIILGNYGLAQQMKYGLNISGYVAGGGNIHEAIIMIFETLPFSCLGLILLIVTMLAFYATTFDTLTMVVSSYSYKKLEVGRDPGRKVRIFWAITFIILPIALIFAENSLAQLQAISLIAAVPIGVIIVLIIISFFRDAGNYLEKR